MNFVLELQKLDNAASERQLDAVVSSLSYSTCISTISTSIC